MIKVGDVFSMNANMDCEDIDTTYGGEPRCKLDPQKETCYFLLYNRLCPKGDQVVLPDCSCCVEEI